MRPAYPALVLCTLACASVPTTARLSTNGSQATEVALPTASSDYTGRGQLLTGSFLTDYYSGETLYDVLRRRAPMYLRTRGNPAAELSGRTKEISVFIDGNYSGGIETLTLLPASTVFSVQRISETEAAVRYGPKYSGGALLVNLVRRD